MKKEIFITIGLGILTALGIIFFVYQSNKNRQPTTPPLSINSPEIVTLPEKPKPMVSFTFPENESVFENKAITVQGEASPHTPVIVFVNRQDFFTQSDESGNWSLDLNLESGSNLLVATVLDEKGQSFSDKRLVVYSNKSLEETLVSDQEIEDK